MPGRTGGANRRTVESHKLHGTYRRDRHGPKVVDFPPQGEGDTWKPSPTDLAPLQKAGRRFLREWLTTYTVSRAEGVVLLQAAVVHDRLAALGAIDRTAMSRREDAMCQRLELGWQKLLSGLLAQLRIAR